MWDHLPEIPAVCFQLSLLGKFSFKRPRACAGELTVEMFALSTDAQMLWTDFFCYI